MIPASPAEIYQAWLDSVAHSEMTGGEATMSDEVGADVSAWDGYITGRNLELVPGERIVQSWRTTEFADEHEDSIVTIVLQETEDGTLLTHQHSNVPDEHKSYEEGGWQSNYFEPMVAYFGGPEEEDLVEPEPEPPVRARRLRQKRLPAPAGKASAGKRADDKPSARKAKPRRERRSRRRPQARQKLPGKPQASRQRKLRRNPRLRAQQKRQRDAAPQKKPYAQVVALAQAGARQAPLKLAVTSAKKKRQPLRSEAIGAFKEAAKPIRARFSIESPRIDGLAPRAGAAAAAGSPKPPKSREKKLPPF